MKKKIALLFGFILLLATSAVPALAQSNSVKAVLFYSPTCGHCELVIRQVLPPLFQQYGGEIEGFYIPPTPEEEPVGPPVIGFFGEELQVLYVNTMTELGSTLYVAAIEYLSIPEEQRVVPLLIVDNTILIGSAEIPNKLPGMISEGLLAGGIEWADIPGLQEVITSLEPIPQEDAGGGESDSQAEAENPEEAQPSEEEVESNIDEGESSNPASENNSELENSTVDEAALPPVAVQLTVLQRIMLDPVGNTLSIIVLIGIVLSVAGVAARSRVATPSQASIWQVVSVPILCLIGLGIAGYLFYIESSQTTAVCGPVGDCNTVQQSQYAKLFGRIPIAGLGLLGYIAILGSWLISRVKLEFLSNLAAIGTFIFALIGTFFSIYLTFLEPFVIGATCAWCLSSAVIITIILWLSIDPAILAWKRIQ